ncbi:MAG: hypothetical protein KDC92_02955 [Bacteroidetes bacterium]|nr:hypothetical protein [Bacteroidota bacterium]
MYEDRLLAKGIVYNMAQLLSEKELAFAKNDTGYFNVKASLDNQSLKQLMDNFGEAKMTPNEETAFEILKRKLADLYGFEKRMPKQGFNEQERYNQLLHEANEKIDFLADIQMTEGKRIFDNTASILNSMKIHTQIEAYFLLIMAVLIQIMVLIKPRD